MALISILASPQGQALLALAVFVSVLRLVLSRRSRKCPPLPPGPPSEPILGHLRVIPTDNPEYAFMRWSREYKSDILSFNILGQPIVVLNSVRAAVDLLDKRGSNYSDRPRLVLFEAMGWRDAIGFLPWGPEYRKHRSVLQKAFQNTNIVQHRPLQERESVVMLRGLLDNPEEWRIAIRRFTTAMILGITYGIKIESDADPFVQIAEDASYAIGHAGAPGGTPVDFFPFLRSLPRWAQDRSLKFAHDWRWAVDKLYKMPYEAALSSWSDGKGQGGSLVHELLGQRSSQLGEGKVPSLSESDIQGAAASVYAAGQDTTWATLTVFVLNMVLRPEVQEEAQRIMDEVVGRDRLPTLDDRLRLRYIDYVVQETLRWCPVTPLGIPHRSLQEDVYEGYQIPAGAIMIANGRAMMHDETTYRDPDLFDPSRYTPATEGGREEPFPPAFGFGRRVCVGRHLAEASVWLVVARMISVLKFEKPLDGQGREVSPVVELTNGLTSHPKKFTCRVGPRDEKAKEVIMKA